MREISLKLPFHRLSSWILLSLHVLSLVSMYSIFFAADDLDPVQVKLFPRDESTGFDTSISVDILDSSIDSTSSEYDRFKDEQLCYLPATSTPLKPRIRPVVVETGRVQYSEASESGTLNYYLVELRFLESLCIMGN